MINCPMCSKWCDDADLRIAELEHCYVTLNRDQFFPGYCFVFARNHVTELFHMEKPVRSVIMDEVTLVAETLHKLFNPAKINYELLGNMVPHMHWHIVPRFTTDPLWPKPIWSEPHEPVELSVNEYTERIQQIRQTLELP